MANLVRDALKEQYQYAYDKDREQLHYQPYRTSPLVTPGAKIKRDQPIVGSYLRVHPDPQVRGAAPHVSQISSSASNAISSANAQLSGKKISPQQRGIPVNRPHDQSDSRSPRVIHHPISTPTGMQHPSPQQKKDFSIHSSEALRAVLEEDNEKPAAQRPKSHVVYDLHEAKVYRPGRRF